MEGASIPVTCFTGFLGAGKTTTILGLLRQLPKEYKVVLLKNEYGDINVDSLLAQQSNITGVSEILNGCLCCTMVGLVENALIEIKEKYSPDRIIIESSGSAFPATLALQIRSLEPRGFKLDGVITVIDCVNFTGYEDTSPSAKLQARYTELLLLSKHQLITERQYDHLMDHLGTLNDETPRIRVSVEQPVQPEMAFGLDTKLFLEDEGTEKVEWEKLGGEGWHGDEVEIRSVWKGRKKRKVVHENTHQHDQEHGNQHNHGYHHEHIDKREDSGATLIRDDERDEGAGGVVLGKDVLERELGKLSFEIYRVKGIVRLPSFSGAIATHSTHILNYAFGRWDLTPFPALDDDADLSGVGARLTFMGERGEVKRRAERFALGIGGCSE